MNIKKALDILKEHRKWRRGEKPYDGVTPKTHKPMPYSPKELGEAEDVIIQYVETHLIN